MGRDLVTNLKFKKTMGQFDPIAFGQMMNEAYTANRNLDRYAKKHTFSPSTVVGTPNEIYSILVDALRTLANTCVAPAGHTAFPPL